MSAREFSYENSDPSLRRARPEDAQACARILRDWIRGTAWMPKLHSQDGDCRFVSRLIAEGEVQVAENAGTICGFLAHKDGDVDALYVAADQRRAGVGSALLSVLKAERDWIGLWTFQANDPARAFYRKHGFAELKQTDGAGNEEKLPDVWLEWSNDDR